MTESNRRTFLQTAATAAAAFALEAPLLAAPRLRPGQAPLKVAVIGAGRQGKAMLTELQKLETVQVTDAVVGSVNGSVRFYGLTPTNMQLEGLDKHLRLIESYKKLHAARSGMV